MPHMSASGGFTGVTELFSQQGSRGRRLRHPVANGLQSNWRPQTTEHGFTQINTKSNAQHSTLDQEHNIQHMIRSKTFNIRSGAQHSTYDQEHNIQHMTRSTTFNTCSGAQHSTYDQEHSIQHMIRSTTLTYDQEHSIQHMIKSTKSNIQSSTICHKAANICYIFAHWV